MSFVRQSKYRHVYGEKPKAEYFGMKITGSSSDGTFASCNPKFLALITQAYGGGSFMVIPTNTVSLIVSKIVLEVLKYKLNKNYQ